MRSTVAGERQDRALASAAFSVPLVVVAAMHGWVGASYVGTSMMVVLVAKLAIARHHRKQMRTTSYEHLPQLAVGAVMPMHNEDPELAVAAVRSMLRQTYPLASLHVIDDGSTDGGRAAGAVARVMEAEAGDIACALTTLPRNVGKRHALAVGFRDATDVDVYLCVDSDTVLDATAVEHGVRPFSDPRVAGVAGLVTALNWRANLLTRLIELRYTSAFLSERAAYSFFGAVLCCCGSLSFYRSAVIRANLDDFVDQQFLGQRATFGDDRRLTNYALRAGRVVLTEASRARTAVPERLAHYVRQQVRWNKSFIRESTWVLGTFPTQHPAFWLTLAEVVGWLVVGGLTVVGVVILPFVAEPMSLVTLVVLTALAAYARSAAFLEHRGDSGGRSERIAVLLLAPLYAVIHIGLLLPIRFWALMTLKRTGWGTRRDGVEVRMPAV